MSEQLTSNKFENDDLKINRFSLPTIIDNKCLKIDYQIYVFSKANKNWNLITESHQIRHFDLKEICSFANETNFELLHAEEWMTRTSPSNNTWSLTIVLKKLETI